MWTNADDVAKDLAQMDDLCPNYGAFPELITSSGRGSRKPDSIQNSRTRFHPGFLDRNGDPIEFDDEDLSIYDDATEDRTRNKQFPSESDLREHKTSLTIQLRKMGNPMSNNYIESYIKSKAKDLPPKKWHSAGSSSSDSFQAEGAHSLDGKNNSYKNHHRKRESTGEKFRKQNVGAVKKSGSPPRLTSRNETSSPEKKKSKEKPSNPTWKRDRTSQNALISNLLDQKNIKLDQELPAEKANVEEEVKKYIPPYRRNGKESMSTSNVENNTTSDVDVIVEGDDFENFSNMKPAFKSPDFVEKLLPSDVKSFEDIKNESTLEFKNAYVENFVNNIRKIEEQNFNEDEKTEKNLGKLTLSTLKSKKSRRMEPNNNAIEKDKKYENLGKKLLKNKSGPQKKTPGAGIYDFEKIESICLTKGLNSNSNSNANSKPVSFFLKEDNEKKEFNYNAKEFPSL